MHRLITRRDHLASLGLASVAVGSLGALPIGGAFAQNAAIPALRSLASARGLQFGSTSDVDLNTSPPEDVALILRQCALFAPNIVWKRISPQPGTYDFSVAHRASVDIALNGGLKLTGGHFLWHQTVPEWFSQLRGAEAERAITDFITRTAGYDRGKVFSWNVSNEAINTREGRPDGLRNESPFVKILGQAYLPPAFHAAKAADPQAILAYNEYSLELAIPEQDARRAALLRLVDYLLQQKAPIDAVGLQSHLMVETFGSFDERKYRAFLGEIASRGLKILITELDVLDTAAPTDTAKRDQVVADTYSRFLNAALEEKAVKSVTVWGLSDRYSYYVLSHDPKFARADRLPPRPLIFDAEFKPKPAFWAVANALKAAPAR